MLPTCSKCGVALKDTTTANCIIIEGEKIICWSCALSTCGEIIEKKGKINTPKRSAQ